MIRYAITEEELHRRIGVVAPSWRDRARERTGRFRALGRYDEPSSIWGEIKSVYAELQHKKCAFCERRLPDLTYGSGEHDVDHFRPKADVLVWPTAKIIAERGLAYEFALGSPLPGGYYLLAYHPLNYAIACRTCNSALKSGFFLVAGERRSEGDHPRDYAAEQPFLIYPIGDLDADPEDLLTFVGVVCVPKHQDGDLFRRALVTIDFFALNGAGREDLERSRAEVICNLYIAMTVERDLRSSRADRARAARVVEYTLSAQSEQTNCARAFHQLYQQDSAAAGLLALRASGYLASQS
ncbi:MAG TPA: hypothetical protein VMM92_00625 [Thermoanaerobaculia bacterium]|nr:hypothetical protein [Thermoanaerobaculia bacterium]